MYTCCKLRTVHRSKAQWYKWCPHNFMKGSAMWTPATDPSPTTYCQHQSWWLFQNQQLTSQPLPSTVNTRAGDYFRTSNYLHNPYHLLWTPELVTISEPPKFIQNWAPIHHPRHQLCAHCHHALKVYIQCFRKPILLWLTIAFLADWNINTMHRKW